MSELTIVTDHKWKNFKYSDEVPEKVLKDQFDHLLVDEDRNEYELDGYFKYRNYWYHLSDFMYTTRFGKDWSGIHEDSFFSGVLLEVSSDCEQYRVGTVMS